MFHSGTTRLIQYWAAIGGGRSPYRADFDPAELSDLLPQLLVLERADTLRIRLAGELLRDLHGRPVKGEDFLELFAPPSRPLAQRSALQAVRNAAPVVLFVAGRTAEAREVSLEILLAPLLSAAGAPDRIVGLVQPTSPIGNLLGQPVREMVVRMAADAGVPAQRPRPTLATVDGRRIA